MFEKKRYKVKREKQNSFSKFAGNLRKSIGKRVKNIKKPSMKVLIPIAVVLIILVVLICIGLSSFVERGIITNDGFAVPNGSLKKVLNVAEVSENVDLVDVELGEVIYSTVTDPSDLYIGEEKKDIDSGYPVFTRSGSVLYFIDDSFNLITESWGWITSYSALYLSDGMTFNADNERADTEDIMLVEVEGGFQLAQEATVRTAGKDYVIPMNSICALDDEGIVYYAYENDVLVGYTIKMSETSTITIGGNTYNYIDFLIQLGLWEEDIVITTTSEPDTSATEPKTTREKKTKENTTGEAGTDSTVTTKQEIITTVTEPETWTRTTETPTEPETTTSTPKPEPKYAEPFVEFDKNINAWIYTLTLKATVEDKSSAIRDGIQIFAYEVDSQGKDKSTASLRKAISKSGEVILSPLEPGKTYHLIAQYTYTTQLGRPQKVTIDIGTATTLDFSKAKTIKLSLRDETENSSQVKEEDKVQIFPNSLQARDIVFEDIKNGKVIEIGSGVKVEDPNPYTEETYINVFYLIAQKKNSTDKPVEIKLGSNALRLLESGYTLSHWESGDVLLQNSEYEYTVKLVDRFGNVFTITPDDIHKAHTCAKAPYVRISVPGETNAVGATRINITYNNPDSVAVTPGTLPDGSEYTTSMYIVKYGSDLIPENAIELKAYRSEDKTKTITTTKYLPIHDTGVLDTTSWTVTNLDSSASYVAVVICSQYDISDERVHKNDNLEEPLIFVSGNIASLGTIPFTNKVPEVSYETATVNLRVAYNRNETYFKNNLIPMTTRLTITLAEDGSEEYQVLELKASDLKKIAIPAGIKGDDDITYATAYVPAYFDGSKTARMIPLYLSWNELPAIEEHQAANIWEYMLYTSVITTGKECTFTMKFGEKLDAEPGEEETPRVFKLKSSTRYVGKMNIFATLGGDTEYDVTSKITQDIIFTTTRRDATIIMENTFISSDFVEIYGLEFKDEDKCIVEDKADRGGNNLLLQVFDEDSNQVFSQYICSDEYYDTLRIDGLEYGKTYTMTIKALQYKNFNENNQEITYTNFEMYYDEPQDEEKPKVYTFTTGDSVNGEITLEGVNYFYEGGSTSASMLKDDDFYPYMHQYYCYAYTSKDNLEQYLNDAVNKESDLKKYNEATWLKIINADHTVDDSTTSVPSSSGTAYKTSASKGRYNPDTNNRAWILNSWTSRFIKVDPGDMYALYNLSETSEYSITFFYVSDDNELRYATWYWNYELYRTGGVFKVPTSKFVYNNKQYTISYMRVSGYTERTNEGIILQKYDPNKTVSKPNLFTDDVEVVKNQYIYYYGGGVNKGFSESYNYTKTYMPVTGGSIYEIKGLDNQNTNWEAAMTGGTTSKITVAFYNSAHRDITSYYVSGQVGLIKAPSGAAFIRVNITRQIDGEINRGIISIKEYTAVNDDEYMADVGVTLTDQSESQILQGGKYVLYMYNVNHSITNETDLSTLPASDWDKMSDMTVTVDVEEELGTKLDISEIYNYQNLPKNAGYKVVLMIQPKGWNRQITIGTIYFNTIRTVRIISNREEFLAIRNDPADNYIVVADLDITNWNSYLCDSDRPFTGSIDFQGHSVIWRSFYEIFYTLGAGASFRNGEISIVPTAETGVGTHNYHTSLFRTNYGTVENIVLHYGPARNGAINEFYDIGAICNTNYGTIDGFVVGLTKDISVSNYFAPICVNNYGSISNGYVYGEMITTTLGETRYARVIHNYGTATTDEVTTTYGNNTYYVSCGVSYNTTRGTMSNIYILTDVEVRSESGLADPDGSYDGGTTKDYSVNDMAYASVLCSRNNGQIDNCFTYGDRIDFGYTMNKNESVWSYGGDRNKTVIAKRGPAVTVSGQLDHAENVTYFSPTNTRYNNTVVALQNSNLYGVIESLRDYQWYEDRLGTDGERFNIRGCIDNGNGYFPQLILPNTFSSTAQPWIPLPNGGQSTIQLVNSEVRQQGIDSAVITLTFNYRNKSVPLKEVEIVDRNGNALTTEVLAQRAVDGNYRVDVLVTMNDKAGAYSKYSLTSVSTNITKYTVRDGLSVDSGEAQIEMKFYKQLASVSDWKSYIVNGPNIIYENYILTNNIDFTESTTWKDWYTTKLIYGAIDGGIYRSVDADITSEAGEIIYDEDGNPRKITLRGELIGMHEISGVGNFNHNNMLSTDRSAEHNSIIKYFYGTLENIVFTNIYYNNVKTVGGITYGNETSTSYLNKAYTGIILNSYSGSTINNVHVRDSYFRGVNYVGGLVAYAYGGTILNSSVKNCTIQTYRKPNTYPTSYVGGMAGILNSVLVKGCFVADTSVLNYDAFATTGAGGVVGYLTNSVVDTCYTTGYVYSVYDYVGGIAGYMDGEGSAVTNCYSSMNVTTLYDFAGSIVGYHGNGAITGNFGAGNVISKASGSNYVHRICSNKDFNSTTRYDNFAYEEQYITYIDEAGKYHYGTWSEDDGASRLIAHSETKQIGTWTEEMNIYDGYDISGEVEPMNVSPEGGRSVSGGTLQTAVTQGYLPKLVNEETGTLLFDQPDTELTTVTDTFMYVYDISPDEAHETLVVSMVLYNSKGMTEDDVKSLSLEDVADWDNINITGAAFQPDTLKTVGTYYDQSVWDGYGKLVEFKMLYGDAGGDAGHYYDYFLMSVPTYIWVKNGSGQWTKLDQPETNSQSITPLYSVFKSIKNIDEWNNFFRQEKYSKSLENIKLIGDLYFESSSVTNVILNRLVSEQPGGRNCKISVKGYGDGQFLTIEVGALISRVASEIKYIDFENIRIKSATNSTRKGIIGQAGGTIKEVNINNVELIYTKNSHRVGFIGQNSADISNVIINNMNIKITSTDRSDYVGNLVGYMNIGQLTNIQVYNSKIDVPNARFCGGVTGYFDGNVGYIEDKGDTAGIYVNNTTVIGCNYVSAVFGQVGSNTTYIRNVYVGYQTDDADGTIGTQYTGRTDSANPGVLLNNEGKLDPSVTITNQGATTKDVSYNYFGGIIGGGNFYIGDIENCYVYNTLIAANTGTTNYIGGIEGGESPNIYNDVVENCTIYGTNKYIGGIEGYRLEGNGNTSKENVIYSTRNDLDDSACVGGVCGYTYERQTRQNLAQHCIVYGISCAGGVFGYTYYPYYENGSLDTLVFGVKNVGGISGYSTAYYYYGSNYVTASETPLTTYLTKAMFPDLTTNQGFTLMIPDSQSQTYTGALIKGTTNVGGLIGTNTGFVYNSYVSGNITVQGTENVGGLVGNFYGWTSSYYQTTTRRMYNCSCGATVIGDNYVGGLIGYYNRSDIQKDETIDTPPTSTANKPNPDYFYGLLFTGTVTGNSNTDFFIGGFRDIWNQGIVADNVGSTMFRRSRIYEKSYKQVSGTTTYAKNAGIKSYESVAARSSDFANILTATAETLTHPEFYWSNDDNNGGGGMGWPDANWYQDSCVRLYTASSDGAVDFAKFEAGIAGKSDLIVWLDGKNNTGNGYTDTTSGTWKNLGTGGSAYDATIYKKGLTQSDWSTLTSSQVLNYMKWGNGGLQFIARDTAVADKYRAQLNSSISAFMNKDADTEKRNFTVEVTITPTKDMFIPSWITKNDWIWRVMFAYSYINSLDEPNEGAGHFLTAFGKSRNDSINQYFQYGAASKTAQVNGASELNTRTISYVVEDDVFKVYVNGVLSTSTSDFSTIKDFPLAAEWFIGSNTERYYDSAVGLTKTRYTYNSGYTNYSSLRVYDRALTATEIQKNAAYDQWYYFEGSIPEGETPVTGDASMWSGSGYTLCRSDDGSYGGVAVATNWTRGSDLTDLGQGYYYLTDGAGNNSTIVLNQAQTYGMSLKVYYDRLCGEAKYGEVGYTVLRGQEGEDANGNLYDTEDNLYQGGNRLPDVTTTSKRGNRVPIVTVSTMAVASLTEALPGVNAYASGIDTMNIELDGDIPTGLHYCIWSNDEVVLDTEWPTGARTVTLNYDFNSDFTVEVYTAEDVATQYYFKANDVKKSVMTYNDGYWYLYQGNCLDKTNTSIGETVHLYDGCMLGSDGTITSVEDGAVVGAAGQTYTVTDTKPLWSGTIALSEGAAYVESYGSYLLSEGGIKDVQLVVRKGIAYTLPSTSVPGSYIVDSYNNSLYTTVLSAGGVLVDQGDAIKYPEDFGNANIRETSNNLNYSGQMILVRYNSGKLVAFNYMTGETKEVLSDESEAESLWDFVKNSIGIGKEKTNSRAASTGGGALRAKDYERDLNDNPSKDTVRDRLKKLEAVSDTAEGMSGGGSDEISGGSAAISMSDDAHDISVSEPIDMDHGGDGTGGGDAAGGGTGDGSMGGEEYGEVLSVDTRFVTYYGGSNKSDKVYDLEELLTVSEDMLVSENERAEVMAQEGFVTSLSNVKTVVAATETSGLLIVIIICCGVIVLAGLMVVIIRKYKLSK